MSDISWPYAYAYGTHWSERRKAEGGTCHKSAAVLEI